MDRPPLERIRESTELEFAKRIIDYALALERENKIMRGALAAIRGERGGKHKP